MPADFVEDPVSLKMLLSQLKIVDADWHKLKMSDLSKGNDALDWLNTELAEWKQDFDTVEKFSCDIKSNEGQQKLMDVDEQRTAEPKSGIQGRRGSNQAKCANIKDKKKQDSAIECPRNIASGQAPTTMVPGNANEHTESRNSKELVK